MTLVLPACAGVILLSYELSIRKFGFTRMRGGDPKQKYYTLIEFQFYPHARG